MSKHQPPKTRYRQHKDRTIPAHRPRYQAMCGAMAVNDQVRLSIGRDPYFLTTEAAYALASEIVDAAESAEGRAPECSDT